ncbi:MAG: hypothetical protein FWD29_02540 [Micrococcales bacterium]|nr:hypothetical protein [Micrococcales bacterium]
MTVIPTHLGKDLRSVIEAFMSICRCHRGVQLDLPLSSRRSTQSATVNQPFNSIVGGSSATK